MAVSESVIEAGKMGERKSISCGVPSEGHGRLRLTDAYREQRLAHLV